MFKYSFKKDLQRIKRFFICDWEILPSTSTSQRVIFISLICLVITKLILTAHEEILTFYLPHDDLWQIKAAARTYWSGKYTPEKLYHLPVYPLFMALARFLGIPLRIALEFFYCGTAWLLVVSLRRIGTSVGVTLLAAVVLIFHPASFQLPNRCGAEILLTPLMMGAIATTLTWWVNRSRLNVWRHAILASIWWAFAWNVRKESIVIIPIFMLMFLFVIIADSRSEWIKSIAGIALMLCFCLGMQTAIKVANWSRWGLYATAIHTAPGFKSAVKSLLSISPAPPIPFIPVPVEVRHRAYAVSPTFAKLKPYLEVDIARGWAKHSRSLTDAKGLTNLDENEIAAGVFYWALYDAAVAAGYGSNPGEADRFFAQVGREIEIAISDGRLPGRWVPMALLDPSWETWLPRLIESLQRVGDTFVKPAVPVRPLYDQTVEEACGADFDQIANRRTHLTTLRYGKAEIQGWAFASDGVVQAITVLSANDLLLGSAPLVIQRPDVDPTRPVGFRVPITVPSENIWKQALVSMSLSDGRVIHYPISQIPSAQVVQFALDDVTVNFAIDRIKNPKFKMSRLWKAQTYLESWYLASQLWLLRPLILAAILVIIISVIKKRPIDLAICIFLTAVGSRYLFFAILDASAWPGDQPRYLYAAYPLFSLGVLLVYARLFSMQQLIIKK